MIVPMNNPFYSCLFVCFSNKMTFFLKTKVHLDSDKGISLKGHQKVNISDYQKNKNQ